MRLKPMRSRVSPCLHLSPLALLLSAALCGRAGALTWHFNYVAGNDQGKKDQITAVMNEAVAIYNSSTNFNVDINVNYDPGIPTAQSDYNGTLGFGGSISTQVALHEIAHYLGSGTIGQWDVNFDGGGVWTGTALRTLIKNYDGPGAEIRKSGVHYYPYGFNYGSEDSPDARRRLPKLIQAMRFDMGLQDGDGDGMSDEWEIYRTGTTALDAAGDADGDRVSNRDEWLQDGDPLQSAPVQHGHTYLIRSRLSQKLMEANGTGNGANVRQNAPSGNDLQRWTAYYVGGGYWKFVSYASNKALETSAYSNDDGGNIQVWDDLGHDYQQWRLVPDSGAEWKIINKGSRSKVVDVEGGTGALGNLVNISQYHDDIGANNQLWSFEDVTAGAPAGPLLQAAYKLDGSARDSSGNEYHGAVAGSVGYVSGRVDARAANFNGVNSSISMPACVDMNFSISFWMRTNATGGAGQWYNGMGLVDAEVPGVATDFGVALVGDRIGFGVGSPDSTLLSANAVNDDQWHHVVVTRDGTSGVLRIYMDNVVQATGTGATGPRMAPTAFRLGSIGGATGFFRGALDEVRIYKGVLTPDEITKLSGAGRAQVAAYGFENNAQDATLYRHHGRAENVSYVPGRDGGRALQLNGVNSFVKIPAAGLTDFSVAYWVKTIATGGTGQWWAGRAMVDGEMPGVANDWGISLVGSKAAFGMGNPDLTISSTSDINDGNWHHIAVSRTNPGAMKLYVDGALQATANGPAAARTAPGFLRVGASMYGGAFFAGTMDDLHYFNYAITPAQVSVLASPLPAPWTAGDIGIPAGDGMAGFFGGSFTVAGAGTGLADGSDQFQFVSSPQDGNRTLITRLVMPAILEDDNATNGARAGLMFRTSGQPEAPFVALVNASGAGLQFLTRDASGGPMVQTGSTVAVSTPCWLRLIRSGDTYSAAYSTTAAQPGNADWIPLGDHTVSLGTSIPGGLAVTAQAPLHTAVATFDSLSSVANGTPAEAWRQQYFGTTANAGDAADDADPDHDGLANLLERALGLAPDLPSPPATLPAAMLDGETVTFNYTRSTTATDLTPQVQWSNDLSTWSSTGIQDTLISSSDGIEHRQARVSRSLIGTGKAFLRVVVAQ